MKRIHGIKAVLLIVTSGMFAAAQAPPPSVPGDFTEIQSYLQLSNTQLAALRQIGQQLESDLQSQYQQVVLNQAKVLEMLSSENRDPTRIGQLEIDIDTQQKQYLAATLPYRQRMFAILTPDQQKMLPVLADASVLKRLASEAVRLHLIDDAVLPRATAAAARSRR